MDFDITACTIFKTLTGSRVYGTATEESDHDYRGVAIPPAQYFLGYRSRFEQFEGDQGEDTVIYGLNKFLRLAADNNPNVIELFYIPTEFWVTSTPAWERIVGARELFLSQKTYSTFRGYAHAQLKRLESHRGWLMEGELPRPTREQFGLPPEQEASNSQVGAALELVQHFLQEKDIELALAEVAHLGAKSEAIALRQAIWDFLEQTLDLARADIENSVADSAMYRLGFDDNMIDRLQREKAYRRAKRHFESWGRWKRERNTKRKELENRVGFDSKHAMHLARLELMCEEILEHSTITLPCPQAKFLRSIRNGEVPYGDLMKWVSHQEEVLDRLKETTSLRHSPDRNAIEALGIELVRESLQERA